MSIPINQKCLITVSEASEYFSMGKKALRSFAVEYPGLAVLHGNKWLIFREKMENQLAMISLGNENESNQFELEWNSEDGFYE